MKKLDNWVPHDLGEVKFLGVLTCIQYSISEIRLAQWLKYDDGPKNVPYAKLNQRKFMVIVLVSILALSISTFWNLSRVSLPMFTATKMEEMHIELSKIRPEQVNPNPGISPYRFKIQDFNRSIHFN